LVVLALLLGAWLAPSSNDFVYFVLILGMGSLFCNFISKRLKDSPPIFIGLVCYAVVVASTSFIIPITSALAMGLAGLLFDPLGVMRQTENGDSSEDEKN